MTQVTDVTFNTTSARSFLLVKKTDISQITHSHIQKPETKERKQIIPNHTSYAVRRKVVFCVSEWI